jgi:hypothetical protein
MLRGDSTMETWALILAVALFLAILLALGIYYIITQSRKRREIESVEVEGPRWRTDEIMPFDEDMEEALYKKRVVCPDCGEDVDPYDEECPACGARMTFGEFECSNCGSGVDPRDKECPQCGEILFPDPFVCPNCQSPVEAESERCDSCGARYWSPIRLDEKSMKERLHSFEEPELIEEPELEERPVARRAYR